MFSTTRRPIVIDRCKFVFELRDEHSIVDLSPCPACIDAVSSVEWDADLLVVGDEAVYKGQNVYIVFGKRVYRILCI